MDKIPQIQYQNLYCWFDSPITKLNCGDKCAPFNENNIPFCCDIRQTVPSVHLSEWEFLSSNTDLWHEWDDTTEIHSKQLNLDKPADHILLACKGHLECQREFRSLTCRAFPFFPYIDRSGSFIGISYYWLYENRCWIISHLDLITSEYLDGFIHAFDYLFINQPTEKQNFEYHSMIMRRVFGRWGREITLLHRNQKFYKISPRTGDLTLTDPRSFDKFSPYDLVDKLPFPEETL